MLSSAQLRSNASFASRTHPNDVSNNNNNNSNNNNKNDYNNNDNQSQLLQEGEAGGVKSLVPLLGCEEGLLKCGSNATWWGPAQLAYAAPFPGLHFLKVSSWQTTVACYLVSCCLSC